MNCTEPACDFAPSSNGEWKRHLAKVHGCTPKEYLAASAAPARWCSGHGHLVATRFFFANPGDKTWGLRARCIGCAKGISLEELEAQSTTCPECARDFLWKGNPIFSHLVAAHGLAMRDAYAQVGAKHCPKCDRVRPLENFSPQQSDEQPFFSYCKDCNLDRATARAMQDEGYTWFQKLVVRLAFEDRCLLCGLSHWESQERGLGPLVFDHVVPHVQGGVLQLDNVALLCAPCNGSKGALELDTVIAKRLGHHQITPVRLRLREAQARAQAEHDRLFGEFRLRPGGR